MSYQDIHVGWLDMNQINSGFTQLDALLRRFYLRSLLRNDQYEENKQEESVMQPQKIQSTIKEEQYIESKNLSDQTKTPRGIISNQDLKSPQNIQNQFAYKTSKHGSIQPQMMQNYINEPESDIIDIIDEPIETNQQNVESLKTVNKVFTRYRQLNESTYPVQQNIGQDVFKESSMKSFQTLKFNDIVYLKFKHENKKESERQELKSFLVITNTRNQLECVSEQVESLDNPVANFRRCLFKIVNPRQALEIQKLNYSRQSQEPPAPNQKRVFGAARQSSFTLQYSSIESVIQKTKKKLYGDSKIQDNCEEEEGDQLVYGKQVMLYHQYSKMFLTFNPQKPAKQNGCISCTLEKYPNSFSIFRMLPNDYSRRVGDKIFDSDVINIQEIKKSQFFLNVSLSKKNTKDTQSTNIAFLQNNVSIQPQVNRSRQQNRIHINASEEQTKFKVKCYINSEQLEQNSEKADEGIAFKTGDIIKIQHLDSGAYLSVTEKKLTRFIQTKNCRVQHSNDENYSTHIDVMFTLRYLDQNKVSSPENFEPIYDSENLNSSYAFWEIQRKDHFQGGDLYNEECFRLKNLSTGLFLARDKSMPGKFSLSWNGKEEDCCFYAKKDKTFNERKKIYQQDTFKIYNSQRKYIHVVSNPEKGKLTLSLQQKISGVSLPYLHAFNTTDKQVVDFLEQGLQIYNTLLQFHYFLQYFAITDKSKGNEETIYSYQESVHQQKKLESEYQYVYRALNELENLLMKDSNDPQFSLQMKQQFLREQKVLELLILIVKLIDTMSHGNRSSQGQKDKSKLVRINNRSVGNKINEKSPQFIANKHLHLLPVKIYNILYLGSKQNANWSSYIFENEDFFSGQLRYYPREVGDLLKEAIKNLCNFKSENGGQGDEIVEWVKLLEPLDESKQNISDQTFYVEFISLAIIDPQQRPLQIYQNKCSTELFSKGKGGQSKAIIQFHQEYANGAYISFYHENPLNEFIKANTPLDKLGQEINKRDRMAFSLEKISKESQDRKQLQPYIRYISAVLALLANLCNGRNKKSLTQIINTLGINKIHIFNALKSPDIYISIKTSYFQIYEVIFLDDEPFLSLAKSENRSYVWSDIEKKFLSRKTAEIFKQLSDQSDIIKSTLHFDQRILPILEEFWDRGLPELEINVVSKFQVMGYTNEQKIEKEEKARAQLQFILSVMRVTRVAMDLGQFTTEKIEFIVNQAVQTLNAFIGFSTQKSLFQQDHWIKKFLNRIVVYGDFDQEFESIIIEVSNLLRLYLRIKLNLQINAILRKFHQEYTSYKSRKKVRELQEDHQQIIQDFTISQKQSNPNNQRDNKKRKLDNLTTTIQNTNTQNKQQEEIASPLNKDAQQAIVSGDIRNQANSFNALAIENKNIELNLFAEKRNEDDDKNYNDDDNLSAQKIENMILTFLLSKGKTIIYQNLQA